MSSGIEKMLKTGRTNDSIGVNLCNRPCSGKGRAPACGVHSVHTNLQQPTPQGCPGLPATPAWAAAASAHQMLSGSFPETLPARVFLDGRNTRCPAGCRCRNNATPHYSTYSRYPLRCSCRREPPTAPSFRLRRKAQRECLPVYSSPTLPCSSPQPVSPHQDEELGSLSSQSMNLVPSFQVMDLQSITDEPLHSIGLAVGARMSPFRLMGTRERGRRRRRNIHHIKGKKNFAPSHHHNVGTYVCSCSRAWNVEL